MRSDILYGIAVADAIGNPLEFLPVVTLEDFRDSMNQSILRVSDDTQMSMFLYEALVKETGAFDMLKQELFDTAYLRWYQSQRSKGWNVPRDGLLGFGCMYHVEAPGKTCMSACRSLYTGSKVLNDSKGNGTVMRCAPIAMLGHALNASLDVELTLALMDARTTHKHRLAGDSSVLLVALYHFLLRGQSFEEALQCALTETRSIISPELVTKVTACLNTKKFVQALSKWGGWVAEEALALAIGAVFHGSSYIEAISSVICIKGDSDTVGSIAGGLAVAAGMPVPNGLIPKLNVLPALEYLFKD